MAARALVLLSLLAFGAGCAYKVEVISRPPGALMTMPGGETVVLPQEVDFRWRPLARRRVQVSAPGYRTMEFTITRRLVQETDYLTDVVGNPSEALGDKPRRTLELVLVPEHGPAGTWTAEELRPEGTR
jgi:hypothetical protein